MFNSKFKKLRKELKLKEQQIQNRNKLIKHQSEQTKKKKKSNLAKENVSLHKQNKKLYYENKVLKDFAMHIGDIVNTPQYGSIENFRNKIKTELDIIKKYI